MFISTLVAVRRIIAKYHWFECIALTEGRQMDFQLRESHHVLLTRVVHVGILVEPWRWVWECFGPATYSRPVNDMQYRSTIKMPGYIR